VRSRPSEDKRKEGTKDDDEDLRRRRTGDLYSYYVSRRAFLIVKKVKIFPFINTRRVPGFQKKWLFDTKKKFLIRQDLLLQKT
jgi:hypothetical protein